MSGAVDLSGLKERAQAAPQQQSAPPGEGEGSGVVTSITITEANFEAEVLQRSTAVPVVVALISSSRSPDSVALADTLERLAAADGGTWALARIDVDTNMRIAQAFGVQAIPTVIALAAGQPLADFQGPQPEPQLRGWIDAILRAVEGKLSGPPAGRRAAGAGGRSALRRRRDRTRERRPRRRRGDLPDHPRRRARQRSTRSPRCGRCASSPALSRSRRTR